MPVQKEIKSHLARLLATEDLVVEHKNVPTAQFNVHTRVLILPLWEKASYDVYDMLVAHEVGHALFTPDEDPPSHIPHQFVNVVEDARIEKLMKRKYLGIAKSFYRGYNELHDQDFFEIDGQDISTFNLADRANLYFKVGSFLPVAYSATEKPIIDLIQNAETFTETLSAAEALYNFCKQEKEETLQNQQQAKLDFEQDSQGSGDLSTDNTTDIQPTVPDTDGSSPMEDRIDSVDSTSGVDDLNPIVETADSFESRIKDLVREVDVIENTYAEIPNIRLDNILVNNSDIYAEIDRYWKWEQEEWKKRGEEHGMVFDPLFEEIDDEFYQFKSDAKKEVSYLVKEFECRKSASAYARSATSRTGVLDTTKLQTYRFNEDLFKRVTVLPDGKNHGLVFVLDWSGSMQYVLQDTLKQLYNLLWFCKKVQIPFEVYAFTQEWSRYGETLSNKYEEKDGVFRIDEQFNLMNLFTSKVNSKTLEDQMIYTWRIAHAFRERTFYSYPDRLRLSGTPLNEALVCLHQILPQFQKENNVEKVQCIVLTDGEAHPLPSHQFVQRRWEDEPYLGVRNPHPRSTFLRDRKLGKTYMIDYGYHKFTEVIVRNLKDRFPSTNFIGIRVLQNRDAKSFMRLYSYSHDDLDIMEQQWRRNKSFILKNSGYDAYFGLSSTTLSQDAEFDVDHDATKSQIKRAFVKSLKTKKLNKKVLGEFIELVV